MLSLNKIDEKHTRIDDYSGKQTGSAEVPEGMCEQGSAQYGSPTLRSTLSLALRVTRECEK